MNQQQSLSRPGTREATPSTGGSVARRGAILASMCFALALVVSAVASLNIALPQIARDLNATQTDLQWIVDSYSLVFAALGLPAGALGDRFGRKGVLLVGLVLFGGAYVVAIFANDPATLIAVRAVAGLGAAAIMPVTLSIITNVYPSNERDHAVAVWAGVAGAGGILGLLISGILLEIADWEWVFGVSAAWAALALIFTMLVAPTSKDPDEAPLDPIGVLLSALGLGAIVFAIIEAPEEGWTAGITLGSLAAGVVLLVLFVLWELRRAKPMFDPRLFSERGFSAATLAVMLQFFCMFGFLFVVLQYLQFVLGYSPLESAFGLIPMAFMLVVMSRRVAPHLAERRGDRPVIAAGLALNACGFLIAGFLGTDSSYWHVVAALLVIGTGMGLATAPATSAIVRSLPQAKQGVASAANNTAREVGGALGIAVLGSILTDLYASGVDDATRGLPPAAREAAEKSIAVVLQASARFGERGQRLAEAAQASFVDGFAAAMFVAAGVLVFAAAAVLFAGSRDRPA